MAKWEHAFTRPHPSQPGDKSRRVEIRIIEPPGSMIRIEVRVVELELFRGRVIGRETLWVDHECGPKSRRARVRAALLARIRAGLDR